MPAVDEIDSSDIEFEPVQNPYAKAGEKSIQDLLTHALEDRIASKRRLKANVFLKGAPGTQYHGNLWWNRFSQWLPTINVKPGTTPNGEHIQRFLSTIAARTKSNYRSQPVPSYKWLKNGLLYLIDALIWHCKDFTLSAHEKTHIETCIDGLLRNGLITREPAKERQWVGFVLMEKLARAWLRDAIENGCISWDVRISRLLSIFLTSAFDSRAGEVVRSGRYTKLECLCWKHIVIKVLDEPDGDEDDVLRGMVARFTLAWEKGKKGKPGDNRKVVIHPLLDNALNSSCVLKVLLAQALRLGMVAGTSIHQVVAAARSRADKTIQWLHAEVPVIPAISNTHDRAHLDLSRPASIDQMNDSLKQAGDVAGLLMRATSHNIRYGGARDIANLPPDSVIGVTTPTVAAAIGHCLKTMAQGNTSDYVGHISADLYTLKATNRFEDPFATDVAGSPRKRRKRAPLETDIYCEQEGLDPNDGNERRKARRRLDALDFTTWVEEQKSKPLPPPPTAGNKTPLAVRTDSQVNTDMNRPPARKQPKTATKNKTSSPIPIDPALLAHDNRPDENSLFIEEETAASGNEDSTTDVLVDDADVENLALFLSSNSNEDTNDLVDYVLFGNADAASTSTEVLDSPAAVFITFLASINVFSNQSLAQSVKPVSPKLLEVMPHGNSRDEPTHFVNKCPHHVHGCPYTNIQRKSVKGHLPACKYATGAPPPPPPPKTFVCDRPGCGAKLASKESLQSHKRTHDWIPKACDKGCEDDKLYTSYTRYRAHVEKEHCGFVPVRCSVSGCLSTTLFQAHYSLEKHLIQQHGLDKKARASILPPRNPNRVVYKPMKCPVGGCRSTTLFKKRSGLQVHLIKTHKKNEEEADSLISGPA